MVLVDTSVWIRFLANRAPYAADLNRLLVRGDVAGHDLVYGELLIGDRGGREALLKSYGAIHQVPVVTHSEVVAFVRFHGLHGRGIGWVDAQLLASAMLSRVPLWTADERLATLARQVGISFISTTVQ